MGGEDFVLQLKVDEEALNLFMDTVEKRYRI
jgi:hypothetical protein